MSFQTDYSPWIVAKFEKIKLICPTELRNEVLDSLYEDGWRVVQGGPKPIPGERGRVSTTEQLLYAEREVE